MRHAAVGTVLDAGRRPAGRAEAFRQEVQGAVAEKAIECFGIGVRVAGKIGAGRIPEKAGTVFHDRFLAGDSDFGVTALTECGASYMHE